MSSPLVISNAHDMVAALCDGRRDWIMRIPADEDNDPDLVIGKALRVANDLYAALETRERLEIHQQECPYPDGRGCVTCATLAMEAVNLRIAALAKARGEVQP